MKSRPLVVGIFDDDRNFDRAVERLAAEGFEDSVFDQATVSEGPGNSGPTPVGPFTCRRSRSRSSYWETGSFSSHSLL